MKTGSSFISKDLKKKQSFELKLRRLCSALVIKHKCLMEL